MCSYVWGSTLHTSNAVQPTAIINKQTITIECAVCTVKACQASQPASQPASSRDAYSWKPFSYSILRSTLSHCSVDLSCTLSLGGTLCRPFSSLFRVCARAITLPMHTRIHILFAFMRFSLGLSAIFPRCMCKSSLTIFIICYDRIEMPWTCLIGPPVSQCVCVGLFHTVRSFAVSPVRLAACGTQLSHTGR